MADTISSLIKGISDNKTVLVNKVAAFGLITEAEKNTAKLQDVTGLINGINVHECEDFRVLVGDEITIPAGYHKGCTIKGGTDEQIQHRYTLQELTVDSPEPDASTNKQVTLTSDGDPTTYYGISKVSIRPLGPQYIKTDEATISASKVLQGEVAYGKNSEGNAIKITGTMPNKTGYSDILTLSEPSINIPEGYHNGVGFFYISPDNERYVEPTEQEQLIEPSDSLSVLSTVRIAPIPTRYRDTTDATIAREVIDGSPCSPDVLKSRKAYGSAGLVYGSMPNNGAFSDTINKNTPNLKISIPKGYHNGEGAIDVSATSVRIPCPVNYTELTPVNDQSGKLLTQVLIEPLSKAYGNVENCSVEGGLVSVASRVLSGTVVMAKNSSGEAVPVSGAMTDREDWSYEVDGINYTGCTIPKGYYNGEGVITFDDSVIINALKSI